MDIKVMDQKEDLLSVVTDDGLSVNYDIVQVSSSFDKETDISADVRSRVIEIDNGLRELDEQINILNKDIDRLTDHSDGLDYAIAATCGVISGIIDICVVGEWDFKKAKDKADSKIENRVINFAKKHPEYCTTPGYNYCDYALEEKGNKRIFPKNPDSLETAIKFLEWKYHLPGDAAYKEVKASISGQTHRLDDYCHHPTLVGLICCVVVQFSDDPKSKYVNKHGKDINIPITINEYGNFVGNSFVTKMFAGVVNWFTICAKTIQNRNGHLMSDVATPAGVPGSLLSLITELAQAFPNHRNETILTKLRDAYVNGIGEGDNKLDLKVFNSLFEDADNRLTVQTQDAVANELKRQALPVIINEVLVRAVYFIRRLVGQIKEKRDFSLIEWSKVLPFNNRTIARMMTVSTGALTAVDVTDAAVRSLAKSADVTTFFSNMILRVNFVGIGRFALAVVIDSSMGISRSQKRDELMQLRQHQLALLDAKVYFKQTEVWISAEKAQLAIDDAYNTMIEATSIYNETKMETKESIRRIGAFAEEAENNNPGIKNEILEILKEGRDS